MKNNFLKNFSLFQDVFGACPHCDCLFRLSECYLYLEERPPGDWLTNLEDAENKIDKAEERLAEKESEMKETLKEKWRRQTQRKLGKIDPVFKAKKLVADDAKVISHPVDFIVFKGMNSTSLIKKIVLLDSKKKKKSIQKSIEKVIEKEQYDWATYRILEDGSVEER